MPGVYINRTMDSDKLSTTDIFSTNTSFALNGHLKLGFTDSAADCERASEPTAYDQSEIMFNRILHEILVPVIFSVIAIFGIFGNGLVLYVIISSRNMRTSLNVLLFNLALGDFCFLLFCVPLTAYHYASPAGWQLGPHVCRIWQYPFFIAFYVNMYTLLYISVWRYLTVVHAQKTLRFRTVCVAIISAAMVWVIMAIANVPTLLIFEVKKETQCGGYYTYCGSVDIERTKVLYLCLSIIGYIIPLVGLTVLNIALLKYVKVHMFRARPGSTASDTGAADHVTKRTQRLTRTVVAVIGAFCTCWLPLHIHMIYGFYGDLNVTSSRAYRVFRVVAQCLAYSNSCMNPVIYQITSQDFRKHFKDIFTKCLKKNTHYQNENMCTTTTELRPLNKQQDTNGTSDI